MILFTLISKGGAVMWPLLALALISVIIVSDRLAVYCIIQFSKNEHKLKTFQVLRVLDYIAQISPVLGFLGTVIGIMDAFKGMGLSSFVGLQDVSKGMYEALFTTAAGLIISIVDSTFSQLFSWWGESLEKSGKI